MPDPHPLDHVTHDQFLEHRSRRAGQSNPERMTNPFWEAMVRAGCNAYAANSCYEFNEGLDREGGPTWCFDRFGMSCTPLPDGRLLYVAGEHEDSYDPDFCIYNDLIVRYPDGDIFIYGYPESDFPTTDFQTATLVGERIICIGNLGYPQQRRRGHTQVVSFSINSYTAEPIACGGESPGWISRHFAFYNEAQNSITVYGGKVEAHDGPDGYTANSKSWTLDLASWRWSPNTTRSLTGWCVTPPAHAAGWREFSIDVVTPSTVPVVGRSDREYWPWRQLRHAGRELFLKSTGSSALLIFEDDLPQPAADAILNYVYDQVAAHVDAGYCEVERLAPAQLAEPNA